MENKKEVAIMFSGGLDSTCATIHYLEQGYHTHLIVFDNGAISYLEQIREKLPYLEKINADGKVKFQVISIRHLMRALVFDDLVEDILASEEDMTCVGCKIAMTTEMIAYCLKRNITLMADGYRKSQDYHPEQTKTFVEKIDDFVAEHGIQYEHPVYRAKNDEELRKTCIEANVPFTSTQTYCVIFSPDTSSEEKVGKYTDKKLPIARSYIIRKQTEQNA